LRSTPLFSIGQPALFLFDGPFPQRLLSPKFRKGASLGEGDVHAEYEFKVREKQSVHFGADLFNVANQKTLLVVDQFQDASLGTPNFDFKKARGNGNLGVPPAYQRPFNARLFAKWTF
jgi:hypothetical protein